MSFEDKPYEKFMEKAQQFDNFKPLSPRKILSPRYKPYKEVGAEGEKYLNKNFQSLKFSQHPKSDLLSVRAQVKFLPIFSLIF